MVQMNGEEKTTNGEEDDNEPFFDVDGEHKDEEGMVLGGDALVAQYLKSLGEDEEEDDDDEEEDDETKWKMKMMRKWKMKAQQR